MKWIIALGALGLIFMTKKISNSEEINNEFDNLFKKYASLYGLDWKFLKRIAWNESRIGLDKRVRTGINNPKDIEGSKSRDGKSWGIMQTTIPTARDYDNSVTEEKLNNPETSIKIGAAHINFLIKNYFKNERDIVMAYNHGQGNQLRFIQLEKSNALKSSDFTDGRKYYEEFKLAKNLIP